jgi:hypothetical protein
MRGKFKFYSAKRHLSSKRHHQRPANLFRYWIRKSRSKLLNATLEEESSQHEDDESMYSSLKDIVIIVSIIIIIHHRKKLSLPYEASASFM